MSSVYKKSFLLHMIQQHAAALNLIPFFVSLLHKRTISYSVKIEKNLAVDSTWLKQIYIHA